MKEMTGTLYACEACEKRHLNPEGAAECEAAHALEASLRADGKTVRALLDAAEGPANALAERLQNAFPQKAGRPGWIQDVCPHLRVAHEKYTAVTMSDDHYTAEKTTCVFCDKVVRDTGR